MAEPCAVPDIFIIANPAAGRGKALHNLKLFEEAVGRHGLRCQIATTGRRGDAEALAASIPQGCPLLAVAGGDGSINEALNGLVKSGRKLPVLPLPWGTANVVASELGLPASPEALANIAAKRRTMSLDLGRIGGRVFAMAAGIGFDAWAVAEVHAKRTGPITMAAYPLVVLKAIMNYPAMPTFSIYSEGRELCSGVRYAVAGNTRRYGGPFVVTPKADPADGLLDICAFRGPRRRDMVKYLALALLGGSHIACEDVFYAQVKSVSIKPDSSRIPPAQMDGDVALPPPFDINIMPKAVEFLLP